MTQYIRTSGAAFGDSTVGSSALLTNSSFQTQADVTLYVDAAGSDSNPGTQALPFLTIQAAVNSLPKIIQHIVTINVGAGTFKGALIEGFTFLPVAGAATGAYIKIIGTMQTATLAGGLTTGTLASATAGSDTTGTFGTATVNSSGWTTDDLAGKFLATLTGTGSGQLRPIVSNTNAANGVITIAGGWGTTPNATTTFAIQTSATVISTGQPHQVNAGGTTSAFLVFNNSGGVSVLQTEGINVPNVYLQNMDITATGYALIHSSLDQTIVQGCSYGGRVALLRNGGSVYLLENVKSTNPSGKPWVISQADATLKIQRCYADTPATLTFDLRWGGVFVISGTKIKNPGSTLFSLTNFAGSIDIEGSKFSQASATGTAILANSTLVGSRIKLAFCDFTNFTTAFNLTGPMTAYFDTVTGTGNTTALNITKGASVQVTSGTTITTAASPSTTEVVYDGTGSDFATMRAATPKALPATASPYGTRYYE